jgi:hypothetical protein
LDLDHVLAAGGRLRRRRRAAVGAASGLAVLVLLVGGAQLARPDNLTSTGVPAAGPSAAESAPAQEPEDSAPLGDVVFTGTRAKGLDQVVWMRAVHEPALPNITFGMVAGRRTATGELMVDIVTNETDGSDRAPGFHGLEVAMDVNDQPTPAFGYFVGDATKITVVANGRTVQAQLATWTEDPSVKLLWFPLKHVKPGAKLGQAVAYDKNGRKLPAGNAGFAAG